MPGLRRLAGELRDVQHPLTLLALGVASALYAVSAPTRAETNQPGVERHERTRVVLVASPGMDELVLRFVAELDSLHLETVRVADFPGNLGSSELERLAVEHSARVAVRVSQSGPAIDLWLVAPRSQELVYRRIVAEGDPAVQALRSLEILRGALIDLQAVEEAPPPPPPGTPPPPPEVMPTAAPSPAASRTWLGASGALLAPHAGSAFAFGGLVTVRRTFASYFAVHGELLAPLSGFGVEGEGGRAKVWVGSASGAALLQPWGERRLTPALGLGVGVLGLRTEGEARAGYEATRELSLGIFPHLRADLGLDVAPGWRVRAAFVAGVASPRPILLFADQRAESWLNPLLVSTLGAEVALP